MEPWALLVTLNILSLFLVNFFSSSLCKAGSAFYAAVCLENLVENNCVWTSVWFFFSLFVSSRQTELDQRALMYSAPTAHGEMLYNWKSWFLCSSLKWLWRMSRQIQWEFLCLAQIYFSLFLFLVLVHRCPLADCLKTFDLSLTCMWP